MKKVLVLLLFLLISGINTISAGLDSTSFTVSPKLPRYLTTRIIDGDTIEVAKIGKVRYIGINTPELSHPKKGMEPYGAEACEINKKLVLGKQVALEFDVQARDRYGRVLAYVYVGSTFVNAYMVETGYAQVMTIPPNVKYAKFFRSLQQKAATTGTGLWAKKPATIRKTGIYLSSIKSNKYHHPDCKWAQAIEPDHKVWFQAKEQAEAEGYLPCKVCNP